MVQNCKDLFETKGKKLLENKNVFKPPKYYNDFIIASRTCENEIIDLRDIIGTTTKYKHEDNWFNMLQKLRDGISYLDKSCSELKKFYSTKVHQKEQSSSKGWHIVFINKDGFIKEGNHRTTIAKFLSLCELIENHIAIPKVTYLDVDLKSLKKFNQINQKLSILKKIVNDEFFCEIKVHNDNGQITYTLSIIMSKQSNNIVESIHQEKFNSIEDLRKKLFEYLKNYLNKREKREKRKEKEKFLFRILIILSIIIVIVINKL